MSSIAVGWALRVRTGSSTRKAILLALADRYNDDTELCCPSLRRIAEDVEASRSCVSSHLKALEEMGIIRRVARTRDNGSRTSNQYELCMGVVLSLDGGSPQTAPPEPELEPEVELDQDLSPASPSKAERDAIWDALEVQFGKPTTNSHRSRFGKVQRELLSDRSLTPPEVATQIPLRAARYRRLWPGVSFTLEAFAKHWPDLGSPSGPSTGAAGPELPDGETF